jgi:hypothetical protein
VSASSRQEKRKVRKIEVKERLASSIVLWAAKYWTRSVLTFVGVHNDKDR